MIEDILHSVQDVWKSHQSYQRYGSQYLVFITRHDIRDMEEDNWDHTECVEEFCDILVNHINYLDEKHPNEDISKIIEAKLYNDLVQNTESPYTSLKNSTKTIYDNTCTIEQTTNEQKVKETVAETIIITIRTLQKETEEDVPIIVQDRLNSRIRGNQEDLIKKWKQSTWNTILNHSIFKSC
jgi:hypothetical protein